MTNETLTSTRPYLLRAMHDWMTDNSQTPLVVVDALGADVQVPEEHIKDGRIVLNIAWSATRNLEMTNQLVSFDARFNGASRSVSFPPDAIIGIYARESGHGMQFAEEGQVANPAETSNQPDTPERPESGPVKGGPTLRIVK
jgi:stringent starvation protein B